ncbi:MAG: DUF3035 domain-containing protein [Rhodospirillales bacterium]|nr:DUF3035 domain-containing protein [Rhodospirillales bacterium]
MSLPCPLRPTRLAIVLMVVATPLLSGCSHNVAQTFGFARSSPDEFAVTTQPPLSMPPDLMIRPPDPGAPRPQAVSASRAAEQALMPQSTLAGPATGPVSPGQEALIQSATAAAGTTSAAPQLGTPANAGHESFVYRMLFGQTGGNQEVVDAAAEQKRLRSNAALGQSPVTGQTPVIRPEKPGFFDRLF